MNNWYDCTGLFIEECSNRFISLVSVNGETVEAYIQCSCRLDNFVNLKGKIVYLKKITNPKRAKYIILAFKKGNTAILLSPKFTNDLFKTFIETKCGAYFGKRKNIKREYTVNDYKSDFYIDVSKIVIEVKSVLSMDAKTLFPTVYSERALSQLDKIEELIKSGYKCYYEIISMNPFIKEITLNTDNSLLADRLEYLSKLGLIIEYKKVKLSKNNWILKKL